MTISPDDGVAVVMTKMDEGSVTTKLSSGWKIARRSFPVIGSLLLAALIGGCASLSSLTSWQAVRVGSPQLVVQSPKAYGWGFLSHPHLTRLPNGVTFCSYNLGGDVEDAKALPELLQFSPAVSTNEGRSWIVGVAARPLATNSLFNQSVQISGRYVSVSADYVRQSGGIRFSSAVLDAAGNASAPRFSDVRIPNLQQFYYLSDGGMVRGTNEILVAGYGSFTDVIANKVNLYKTCLFRSTDEGTTWSFVSFIAEPKDVDWGDKFGFEGPCEPALFDVGDGQLICVTRTGGIKANPWVDSGRCTDMAISRSKDGGLTWKTERMFRHAGVMPRMASMPNGALVLAYGRPGNVLTVSYDKGHTWSAAVPISESGLKTSGYIGIMPVGPNRLLCVYDMYNTDLSGIWLWEPKEVNGVFSVFVEIAPGPNAKGTN